MSDYQPLGRSPLMVPRLGVGAMTWGDPAGMARFTPAKLAYGGPASAADEEAAFTTAVAAGVTLFDTAAMYSGGASERRLGELAEGSAALIATKFPPRIRATRRGHARRPAGQSRPGCAAAGSTCTSTTSRPDGSTSPG